jgi:signal recognition particle receptor subunit beta
MDWKQASAYYEAKLTDVLNLQRHALDLAKLPQTGIPHELKQILIDEAIPATRQLERLKKREFRIAVVGLEKAGKSTFINAWLDSDLLPSKNTRCTFTTTQIFSVSHDSEQRLEVEPHNEENFSQLIADLTQAASEKNENAIRDLATIKRYQSTLQQVRNEGRKTFPFTRLEEIKESLRQYVADEQFAHAVFEARLYTSKLAQAEGIVFYDVPGLDSGLAKHVEESREMLSNCDAVIVVTMFASIRAAELEIIKFIEQGDPHVTAEKKLFVFLSKIDDKKSPEAMQEHINDAIAEWQKHARLPQSHLVHGSAGSYLVLKGIATEQTIREVGDVQSVSDRIQSLMGIEDRATLSNLTGIEQIKERVNTYINTERVKILQERCEALSSQITSTSQKIFELVRKRYSDNPEQAKRQEENQRRIEFSQWWEKQWERIEADLAEYYDSKIRRSSRSVSDPESLVNLTIQEKFKQRYLGHIDRLFQTLRNHTAERRELIFKKHSIVQFDSVTANYAWREELYADISQMLIDIAKELAIELKSQALELIEYMTSLLWDSKEVKRVLIEDTEDYVEALNRSLSVLFLRFARPMVESLIRGPVGSETRQNIVKSLGVDIEILDNYYQGEEEAFKMLRRYVKYGRDLLYNTTLRKEVLGIVESIVDLTTPEPTPEASVIAEVGADLNAVESYLKSAIFEAAGFQQYCLQELDRLRDLFINSEAIWRGVTENEWLEDNPKLLSALPAEIKNYEVNLEVSERLRQLAIALAKIGN